MRRRMVGGPGQIGIERHLVGWEAGGGVPTEEGWGGARQGRQREQGVTAGSAPTVHLRGSGGSI